MFYFRSQLLTGRVKNLLYHEQADTLIEIASIKSVNLDFVKHSLLTRKVIKIEKKIETFQSQHAPKVIKVKNFFRVCRIIIYVVCGVYLSQVSLVMVNPKVLWPISWFARGDLIYLSPMSVLCVSGLAFRHILRTFSSIFCCNVVLP